MFGLDDKQTSDDSGTSAAPEPTSMPVLDPPAVDDTPATPDLAFEETPVSNPVPDPVSEPSNATDDLEMIKKEALEELSPLVDHLDQSPEEKFHVTMMMIQAKDDKSLIGKAYESAKAITDDKARAQALYDLVSEINYFEHKEN